MPSALSHRPRVVKMLFTLPSAVAKNLRKKAKQSFDGNMSKLTSVAIEQFLMRENKRVFTKKYIEDLRISRHLTKKISADWDVVSGDMIV